MVKYKFSIILFVEIFYYIFERDKKFMSLVVSHDLKPVSDCHHAVGWLCDRSKREHRPAQAVYNLAGRVLGRTMMADWKNRVEGNWNQLSGKVKEQWAKLTDDDLAQIKGNRQQLEGRIQELYATDQETAKRQVDDWYKNQS